MVDCSAPSIVGDFLLDGGDKRILHLLAKSKDIWERRIAIISTYTFIKNDKLGDTFDIAEILINDGHDLIQKAVGWMLREAGKKDQKALEHFLKKHYDTMPRTMLRYAIEKFPEDLRQKYLLGEI